MSDIKKVALVTGASRGIGKSIALTLARSGITVIGTATSDAGAAAITDYLKEFGGRGIALNVNDKESIDSVVKNIAENEGDVTILVNNAGITKDTLLLRMKEEDWDAVLDTNLKSVFLLVKATIRGMTKAQFGRIINIASVIGFMGNPGQLNYSAAKGGMIAMTKSLAKEFGSRNITANCVAPGFIQTDMTDKLSEDVKAAYIKAIPLGRLGQPEDIANAVKYLASDDAGYVTGSTIHVNGGMYV
ncbi:3-oxoacyl-ACP reductase FabG [Aquella oligotrophica]|uniref:3-oxoacyl-[acyl-carrier-protein] reductase n=1 Tax=Aquella oligotrophica TaxID=2067065 RepID=A0A2I7N4T5_9NEIS|nr:3-oxoacyl-ACP reductase FabG [Aquella oligotrophica]AUR51474.1 3-oxoacyl-ACP reductase [Aquella oligotrophica]